MTFTRHLFMALAGLLLLAPASGFAQTQGQPPGFSKAFGPDTIGSGSTSTLTFTIDNGDFPNPATDLTFTDTLPAGMTIAAAPNAIDTCSFGTVTAPANGTTIDYSGGAVAPFASCTISVDVTANVTATNTSGDLISSEGNSGPASATLTVSPTLPAFSKSFAPGSVPLNATSTLTFTIGGPVAQFASVAFTDTLPAGLTIAPTPNASTTCSPSNPPIINAPAGGSTISFSSSFFPAQSVESSCIVQVDVLAGALGTFGNTSGPLLVNSVTAGTASDSLTVYFPAEGPLALTKSFVDDPVGPGQMATLDFSIYNSDPTFAATAIGFTDVLDATLTGATLASVNSNSCGGSLTGVGTNTLGLSGANLVARANCALSVEVQVPPGATAGSYLNTTSQIAYSMNGDAYTDIPAQDSLQVLAAAPLIMTKSMTSDAAGGTTTLTLNITNPNGAGLDATDIAFEDDFAGLLNFLSHASEDANTCGGTLIPNFGATDWEYHYVNGSLAAGASCTITAQMNIDAGASPGSYTNTTGPISATIGGASYLGAPASAGFTVTGGLSLNLTKVFADDFASPGSNVDVSFTINNSGDGVAASQISFSDDLTAFHAGSSLAAAGADTCGGTLVESPVGTLSYSGGALAVAPDSCTISATLTLGAGTGPAVNTTSDVSASPNGGPVEVDPGSAGSDSITVSTILPLVLSKSFTDDPVFPGGTVNLEFTLANPNAVAASAVSFNDNLNTVLSGLAPTGLPVNVCGGTLSAIGSTLLFSNGAVAASDSCTFSATLNVPALASAGTYNNVTSLVQATVGSPAPLGAPATDTLTIESAEFLSIAKTFTNDPVMRGTTAALELTISNGSSTSAVTALTLTDDLDAMLTGATGTVTGNTCGGTTSGGSTVSLSGGILESGVYCTINIDVAVPAGAVAGSYPNTTSAPAGTAGTVAVTGLAGSDTLVVLDAAAPVLAKEFLTDLVAPGAQTVLRFTLTNPADGILRSDLRFSDDLSGLGGLSVAALPAGPVCGSGGVSGTTLIEMSGGELAAGTSCSFDVTLAVAGAATAGTYVNTTTNLMADRDPVAPPATDTIIIAPLPGFAKAFTPATVVQGEISTLSFTIDNAASALEVADLAFNDLFPAGMEVAAVPNVSNGCTGSLVAPAGATSITYSGGSVASFASCTISVDVRATGAANMVNTSGDLTSSLGNSGPASATLTVTAAGAPGFAKVFTPATVAQGETSTLRFTIDNSAAVIEATALTFSDLFPAGMEVAAAPNDSNTCGGTFTAAAGATSVSLAGGAVAATASCAISVDVRATGAANMANTSGDLTSSLGNSGPASATLNVTAASAPAFSKTFTPDTITQGGTSTLSFAIDNSGAAVAATALAFSDLFPAGMEVAAAPNASNSCGGTFTAAAGATSVSLAGGTVAATASCAISVDVLATAAATMANTSRDLTSSLGNSGPASATLMVEALPTGSVTIVQQSDTDDTFGFSSATPGLTFDIVTVGGSGQHGPVILAGGTYIVTQSRPAGFANTAITCSDADSSGDPATGILTLMVDPGEAVSCTFASRGSAERTSDVIRSFLGRRADLILANRPDPDRRIDRLNQGAGAERLSGTPGFFSLSVDQSEGGGNVRFSTSMAQVTRANAAMQAANDPSGAPVFASTSAFDIWFEGSYSKFSGGDGIGGDFGILYLGADYLVTPDLLVGALVQYDRMHDSSAILNYSIEGEGWMAGPYMTARLAPNLYFDGRLAWGRSTNQVSPYNTYTDTFPTTRRLAEASIIGEYQQDIWTFRPNFSLSFMEESQPAYTDSLSVVIPAQTVSRGQVRFGPNISANFSGGDGNQYEPFFTLDAIYSLDSSSGGVGVLPGPPDGWRGRLEGGLRVRTQDGLRLSLGGHYDGLGQPGFTSWGASLELELEF